MPEICLEQISDVGADRKQVKLAGTTFTLGRSQSCHFAVTSDVASRQHAEIRLEGAKWIVADLGSSNGTWLNDRRVDKAEIRENDVVMIGKTGVRFRVVSLDPAPPPRNEDLESTRVVTPKPKPASQAPPRQAPPRAAPPPARAPAGFAAPAPAKKGFSKMSLFLFLLFAGFGVFTTERMWEKESVQKAIKSAGSAVGLIKDKDNFVFNFPYRQVLAPKHWVDQGYNKGVEKWTWFNENFGNEKRYRIVLDVVFGLYFGLFGFFLAHPIRRWFWILLFAGAHVAAFYTLPKAP